MKYFPNDFQSPIHFSQLHMIRPLKENELLDGYKVENSNASRVAGPRAPQESEQRKTS